MTRFEAATTFQKVWKFWPKKEMKQSSLDSFNLLVGQRIDIERFILCCEIYAKQVDLKYCKRLGNFIREGMWKDFYAQYERADEHLKELELIESAAKEVIAQWNLACKPHWATCESVDEKIEIAKDSLKNNTFRSGWRKALKIAEHVFREPLINDWKSKINLTLGWFLLAEPKNNTVAKLLDGEYGTIIKKKEVRKVESKPITKEDLKDEFDELFGKF